MMSNKFQLICLLIHLGILNSKNQYWFNFTKLDNCFTIAVVSLVAVPGCRPIAGKKEIDTKYGVLGNLLSQIIYTKFKREQ